MHFLMVFALIGVCLIVAPVVFLAADRLLMCCLILLHGLFWVIALSIVVYTVAINLPLLGLVIACALAVLAIHAIDAWCHPRHRGGEGTLDLDYWRAINAKHMVNRDPAVSSLGGFADQE